MTPRDIIDFFNVDRNKFNFQSWIILFLSVLFTITTLYFVEIIYHWLNLSFANNLTSFKIMMYAAVIIVFLFFYIIFQFILNLTIWPRVKKQELNVDFTITRIEHFIKYFNFQGLIADEFHGERCLFLNNSPEGLITKKIFSNYVFSFDAKLLNHGFGIITNAQNLENLFMFRVGYDSDTKILNIVPHIRKNGIWEVQDSTENDNYSAFNINDGITLKFIIVSNKNNIDLSILNKRKKLLEIKYLLPTRFPILPKSEKDSETPNGIVLNISWPKFHRVGFRAHGKKEKVILYNLSVHKL